MSTNKQQQEKSRSDAGFWMALVDKFSMFAVPTSLGLEQLMDAYGVFFCLFGCAFLLSIFISNF
jgi:hypothetical protein